MGIGIRIDMSALDLVRRLNASELALYSSMEKLSSGWKINRASDGPAVLVISERLRSQIASLGSELENLSAQQQEYGYASSVVMDLRADLLEVRSLALGAAHEGYNDPAMQGAYETAAQAAVDSYNQIASTAEYNGQKLFDGSEGSLATIRRLDGIDLSSASAAEASLEAIDRAVGELDRIQIDLGARQKNELEAQQRSLAITQQNLIAAESSLRDTDYALEYTNFVVEAMRMRAGVALWAHSRIAAHTVLSLLGS
jgi:flagellin